MQGVESDCQHDPKKVLVFPAVFFEIFGHPGSKQ